MKRLRVLTIAGYTLLCAAAAAHAQQAVDYASVSGRVSDASGGTVPGATVTARHVDTNVTATAVTDGEGRFRFPYLRVGPYEIVVRLEGFGDAKRLLTLTVGAAFELPVTLQVAGLDTTVAVTADATILEAARSQISSTVSEAEVRAAPLNGRNFLELALLVPGVSPTRRAGSARRICGSGRTRSSCARTGSATRCAR